MASVWGELKRRNVVKVAVAYGIVGWLLVQIADVFFPALQLPEWTVTFVAGLVILGFPLALILSWAYELTPQGIERAKSAPLSESIGKVTGRKLDFVVIGLLVLAVGFMFVDNYLPETRPFAGAEIDPASLHPEVDTLETDEQTEVLPSSVAVLLCDNLSPNPDDAYFAEGIHEEILNQLVKIQDLNVIARTSVLQYAEAPPPIPQIADELNVGAVVECSVRYAGDAILVTAQLIDPETNSHLWSDTYPGDLSDLSTLFAMQADIAMNIANSVGAEFSLAEQESIEAVPTNSPAAYTLYLRGLTARGGLGDFAADFDRAIQLDPEFALAYAQRAWDYSVALNYSAEVGSPAEVERISRESAERALQLDPSLGLAHSALAGIAEANWRWAEARGHAEQAYELSPSNIGVIGQYGRILRTSGEYARAVQVLRQGTVLDPNSRFPFQQLGIAYRAVGEFDLSAAALEQAVAINPTGAGDNVNLAITEVRRGNFDEAVRRLHVTEQLYGGRPRQPFRYGQMALAYAQAGQREDAIRLFSALEERATETEVGDANWALAHIALGEYDRALERLEAAMETPAAINYTALVMIKNNDWADPELEQPRFKEVLAALWSE